MGCKKNGTAEILIAIAQKYRGEGLASKTLNFLEEQIKIDDCSNIIEVTVKGTNPHKSKLVKLLKNNDYKTYPFPIKDAVGILERGIDVSFRKEL